ncbi:hypothetical protein [Rhodoblastus sp.]|uniref:hypothetical protein n=1 Tax=Rhodoblastus sp. TaxID=1962975 RepID=UPI003F948217
MPGSRILDGAYQTIGVAIAVRKDRPDALAYLADFIEKAKADGAIRRAFDAAGLDQLLALRSLDDRQGDDQGSRFAVAPTPRQGAIPRKEGKQGLLIIIYI